MEAGGWRVEVLRSQALDTVDSSGDQDAVESTVSWASESASRYTVAGWVVPVWPLLALRASPPGNVSGNALLSRSRDYLCCKPLLAFTCSTCWHVVGQVDF